MRYQRLAWILSIFVAVIAFFAYGRRDVASPPPAHANVVVDQGAVGSRAFDKQANNTQVKAQGSVIRILPDDNDGSRHQRFIVRLASGQTVLIAHNVDLAPRVSALRQGDDISFSGVYEWNEKGGIVHWTHRDPEGRHQAGWIRHNGQLFQ